MAGKKGKGRNDVTNINPALVPSAAFTVVPRTPAPDPVPTTGLGGSREILSSSLLGRPAVPNPGQDDELFSDPESSLYDYQNMEEAGYSSVEMLALSRQRRQGGVGGAASSPSLQRREHDIDELQQANVEPLYSMPMRRSQREGQRRSDKPLSARSLHFPVEHETAVKARVSSSPSTPVQPPKKALSVEEIISQEIIQEISVQQTEPVAEEPVIQSHRSQRSHADLVSTSRSQLHSARSGGGSARSISVAEEQVRSLKAENEHLANVTGQLENEVQSYKEMVSTFESGQSGTAESLLAKKQINDLKEENESLKNSVRRLNTELSAYQAKYRPIKKEDMPDSDDPHIGHPIIRELNIRYLNPLFLAYDDRLKERDETIRKCQNELDILSQRTQEVVRENEKLHTRLEQAGTGPIDSIEWAQMKENARLVLEENQNLLEQINVKDMKAQDLHQAHVREVAKISKQMVQLKAEKSDLEREVEELRQSHRDLKQRHDKLILESQSSVTQEQHIKEMSDLKQKMVEKEELQKKELDDVNNRLAAVQVERKTLASQVVDLQSENRRHQTEIRVMHKSVRKAQQKMMLLQRAIETSENKEMTVQEYMASLIKVAEKNAFERDTYEKVAKEHEVEIKRTMKKLLHGNITVGKMEEKLKLYKMRAAARIGTVAERLKEQEELFNSQKKEYEREINHLRHLVNEKEEMLQLALADKKEVEDQLEATWQSANSENVRIQEDLQKNLQKLRKHKGLSDAIDEHDKIEGVYVSSDEEGEKLKDVS